LAVATYTYDALPPSVREAVPTDDELAAALGATISELEASHTHPLPNADESGGR